MAEFRVEKAGAGQRLDHFLVAQLPHLSRSRIQALAKAGHVTVNAAAAKPGAILRQRDLVTIDEPAPVASELAAEEIPLAVLFEDEDLIVINKPPGLVVHPAAGNREHTLVNALLHHCPHLSGIGGEQRPGIVHRLDKETSGCLVVAKSDFAHANLARQFAGRTVLKIYLALVAGSLKNRTGVIEEPIGRHPVYRQKMAVVPRGRSAKTTYRVVEAMPQCTLVECILHTGRTHQIRVHLKHLGHPVLGDKTYAPKLVAGFPRQMLHAWKLAFTHPRTGRLLESSAPLPADFLRAGVHSASS